MPVIKPRTRGKQVVRLITRLDRENHDTLFAYAEFIGEPADYVVNQLIDAVLAQDKEFVAWRAEHPESYVPANATQSKRKKRSVRRPDHAPRPRPVDATIAAPASV